MAQDLLATSPQLDIKKRWALMQLQNAGDASPVLHPAQAVARALQGAMGGYIAGQAEAEDRATGEGMFRNLPGVGGGAGPSPVVKALAEPAPVSSEPRGIRNNNPGNIEDGPFAKKMPGYVGTDGRFARFESSGHGERAMDTLLASYGSRGINTVGGVVNRWAPKADKNPTDAYAATVAKGIGVDPNAPIDLSNPTVRQQIAAQLAGFENGRPYQIAGAAVPPPAMPSGAQPPAATTTTTSPTQAQGPARQQLNIPPEVQETIKRLGADPRTRPQAWQLYLQYAKPVESVQPMSAEERKKWFVPEGVSAGIDRTTGKPVYSQPANSVNVNTAANPLIEGVGKQILARRGAAQSAAETGIPAIHQARKSLDDGAITGAFAEGRLGLTKIGNLFSIGDPERTANTEVLMASLGDDVLAHIKELGANPSNADRDYIERVKGGKITLDETSIRRLLDIKEKYARQSIRNFNSDSKKLMDAPGGAEAYKSVAPLMRFDEPAEYVIPKKPGTPAAVAAPSVDHLLKKYGK